MRSVTPSADYSPPFLRVLIFDVKDTCVAIIYLIFATVFSPAGDSVEILSPSMRLFILYGHCCRLSLCTFGNVIYSQYIPSRDGSYLRLGLRILEVITFVSCWKAIISIMLGFPIALFIIIITLLVSPIVSFIIFCIFIYVDPSVSSSSSSSIDWSHLPLDLVQEIVNQITTFRNYIAAKGVNRDWRSAFSSTSLQLPRPALLLSEPLLTDRRTVFSPYDNIHYRLKLSEVRGKRTWGSQHGWVVTLGRRYVTQLVHLMTGKRINLPKMQRLASQEEWFCLVNKFNLLKDPTDESTFLVFAIFGPMNSLAFTRVRLGATLNRRGEGEWVVVANPENLKFMDITHFNDQIYALCDNGKLVRFEPDAPLADMVQVIADHPQDVGSHLKIYLVESLGNVYAVFRNGFLIPSERRFETTSFFVYKLNLNASAWEEVTHLEGQTFFVGDGNSSSWRFPTSIIPSLSDCIYFADDHWVWRKFPRKAYGGHDVGLFHMATGDILPLKFGKDKPRFYSRPIFVTRNDKL